MVDNKTKNEDISYLSDYLKNYVNIITQEYGSYIPLNRKTELDRIDNYEDEIKIENTGTITLYYYNSDKKIHLPELAYDVINEFKKNKLYGSEPNHSPSNGKDLIDNDNTFEDYIEHAIKIGISPRTYFSENLLHETMHFCGSDGADPISEGLTELRTRELAKKYGLLTTGCGYPKEVKLVKKIENVFGKDICSKILFERGFNRKKKIILENLGKTEAELFDKIFQITSKKFNEYIRKSYNGIDGPYKKAEMYNKINYSEVDYIIEEYERGQKNIKEINSMLEGEKHLFNSSSSKLKR